MFWIYLPLGLFKPSSKVMVDSRDFAKKNCTKERQQIKQNKDKTLSYPKSTTFTCVYKSGI